MFISYNDLTKRSDTRTSDGHPRRQQQNVFTRNVSRVGRVQDIKDAGLSNSWRSSLHVQDFGRNIKGAVAKNHEYVACDETFFTHGTLCEEKAKGCRTNFHPHIPPISAKEKMKGNSPQDSWEGTCLETEEGVSHFGFCKSRS
ncbi:hypothetical protein ANANG_G00106490 [Anguilla anguilla]|uniref:Uncharacterized protein n=1 Tax=Anguilla anguilla TaxID=7936 RepID=A0A9D3RZK8_ANGAN|nr:hypothetical protein ANANG_G00106490 [Anguilla anguilla]